MALNTQTLGDVVRLARRQFGDESGVQIEDSDIIRATNQACMEIVSKNKVLRAIAKLDSVAGQEEYSKPDDCLQLTSVKYRGSVLNYLGFDEFQGTEASKAGEVRYWTQYGAAILLAKAPDRSEEDSITVFYIPEPAAVSQMTDVLPVPDRYFERICEFVMSKLYEIDEDWQGHQVNRQMFEDNLNSLNYEESNTRGPFESIALFEL